jgi:hypothetical protein
MNVNEQYLDETIKSQDGRTSILNELERRFLPREKSRFFSKTARFQGKNTATMVMMMVK